ncbi:LysE family translocator [Rhodobacteraceae bacterium LMO-12]|nr:LysE family translocator [Rhodobacteraceae bacterium LMO-JJ12]
MEPAHLIAFNFTLLAALASPGPAMLVAIRATLLGGRSHGIATGLGLGTMAALWTGTALLGLDALLALFPWAYLTLKVIGATYLIWIAIQTWRHATTPLSTADSAVALPRRRRAFLSGVLVNFANPKAVLFAASVLVVIFPSNLSGGEKLLIVTNHMLVEFTAYILFALALSTGPARDSYLRLKPLFDRTAAAVLGTLGLRLLIDR